MYFLLNFLLIFKSWCTNFTFTIYCLNLPARQLLLLRGICLKIETVLSTVVPKPNEENCVTKDREEEDFKV